jgi:hypothetical protein
MLLAIIGIVRKSTPDQLACSAYSVAAQNLLGAKHPADG